MNGLAFVSRRLLASSGGGGSLVSVLSEGCPTVQGSSLLVISHFEQFQQCPNGSEVTLMFQKQSF